MNVLLDTCVWSKARAALADAGHDVVWCGDWVRDPGDATILRRAWKEGRVLVTLDKDYGELAILGRLPHHGIIRLVDIRPREQGRVTAKVLADHPAQLAAGAIITVERHRTRIRPADAGDEVSDE